MAAAMLFTLAACGTKSDPTPGSSNVSPAQPEMPDPEPEPQPEPQPEPEPEP